MTFNEILNAFVTPSVISMVLSVWIIPPAIKRYETIKKRRVIALVLGDAIKQIDLCITGIDFVEIDRSRRSQVFINSDTKPTFVHYAIAFEDELLLLSNIMSYLNHYNDRKMCYCDAMALNRREFERMGNVQNTLQNIISNYSELLSNGLLEQIVDILFLMGNLNIDSIAMLGVEDDSCDNVILTERPECTKRLDEAYKSLFRLQHRLMNSSYFICKKK